MTHKFSTPCVQICQTYPRTTNINRRDFIAHHREEQVKHLHPAQQTRAAKNMSERVFDRE